MRRRQSQRHVQPEPVQSRAHAAALELARAISDHLSPRTGAYHEIWLDGEKVVDTQVDEEPIYGRHYLPRKFKTVVAVPPSNDVDVFAQDLGFIAITGENDEVVGYDVAVGGGMGMTHGEPECFRAPPTSWASAGRAGGRRRREGGPGAARLRRSQQSQARAAQVPIEDRGIDWFRAEVERRLGYALEAPRPFAFEHTGDRYGWVQDHEATGTTRCSCRTAACWTAGRPMRTGWPRSPAHQGDFRLTANQNLMIARVRPRQKRRIEKLLAQYRLDNDHSGLRLNSRSPASRCRPAASRWPRARYLPDLVTALEEVILRAGLRDDDIVIRMTGCPNGCARPYLAEIGLVGRTPASTISTSARRSTAHG